MVLVQLKSIQELGAFRVVYDPHSNLIVLLSFLHACMILSV